MYTQYTLYIIPYALNTLYTLYPIPYIPYTDANKVTNMVKGSLKQKIPVDIMTKNSTYDPYAIENANHGRGYKGGSMPGKPYMSTKSLTGTT